MKQHWRCALHSGLDASSPADESRPERGELQGGEHASQRHGSPCGSRGLSGWGCGEGWAGESEMGSGLKGTCGIRNELGHNYNDNTS